MLGNERIGGFAMLMQHTRRACLVGLHQPAVAGNVGRENRREFSFDRLNRQIRLLPERV